MRIFVILLIIISGCKSSTIPDESIPVNKPVLVSSSIANGANNVAYGKNTIKLSFDQNIVLSNKNGIVLNGYSITDISAAFKVLEISVDLSAATSYTLQITNDCIKGPTGTFADAISIQFKSADLPSQSISSNLVVPNPTTEAKNLYSFLRDNFEKKTLSGTMANVSWNINEAEWVFKHTGKYPALNGFDLIHLYASPTNWINYSDTKVVEDWWNNKGIVTMMWHWNVPTHEGSSSYQFYTKDTQFDISRAVIDGTSENAIVKADLEKVSTILLQLKNKNIPVLWRPLHEASGKWFWWGAKDAASYKKLWVMMFDYFKNKNLNNLIWIWTTEANDPDWYPGNDYVDIIGCDLYNKTTANAVTSIYNQIKNTYTNKLIALSEFGNVADFNEQWDNGSKWSWIMPWYDYNRTVDINQAAFNEQTHSHATISYWNKIISNENIITRDKMPSLK